MSRKRVATTFADTLDIVVCHTPPASTTSVLVLGRVVQLDETLWYAVLSFSILTFSEIGVKVRWKAKRGTGGDDDDDDDEGDEDDEDEGVEDEDEDDADEDERDEYDCDDDHEPLEGSMETMVDDASIDDGASDEDERDGAVDRESEREGAGGRADGGGEVDPVAV
jgi:hypothetical protein